MKTALNATLGAVLIASAMSGSAFTAQAHDGVAFGILGGFAAGAIIGSAVAPRPYYYPAPAYYGPAPVYYAPRCYWTEGRLVWDGYQGAWVRPRVKVCS